MMDAFLGLSAPGLVSTVTSLMHLKYPAGKLLDAIVLEVLHRGPDVFSTSELSQLAAALTETKHCDVMTDVLMDSIAVTCQKRMQTLRFEELGKPSFHVLYKEAMSLQWICYGPMLTTCTSITMLSSWNAWLLDWLPGYRLRNRSQEAHVSNSAILSLLPIWVLKSLAVSWKLPHHILCLSWIP